MTVGERVTQVREQKGWSLGQLAAYSGVSVPYLSRLERNHFASPGSQMLLKIAGALGVALEDLTGKKPLRPAPMVGSARRTRDISLPIYEAHAGRIDFSGVGDSRDTFDIPAHRSYAVRVTGDCLYQSHKLEAGDEVIVDRERQPVTGSIVAARIGDDVFLAEWLGGSRGGVQLRLSDGQVKEARVHDVVILGVATKRVSDLEPRPGHGDPGWLRTSR